MRSLSLVASLIDNPYGVVGGSIFSGSQPADTGELTLFLVCLRMRPISARRER
jgi:hypothetical protein